MSVFGAYAAYYDLLNAGKDYAGEADYVERLLRRAGTDHGVARRIAPSPPTT